jgi:hypothetical protein
MAQVATTVVGGTIGAATGLAKGVGSALGETTDKPEKDTTGSDEQGKKALPPGVKLNKNGVMVQDKGGAGGGQVLPGQFDDSGNLMSLEDRLGSMEAPDRGDAGPLQQILDYVKVIAANTARTAAGVGTLSTNMQGMSAQGNIDDEKGNMQGEGQQGVIGKMFSSVGKTLKAVGSSFGKTAKFMIKGLALGGLLYLFINKKDEIQDAVAGIFKYFHELYIKLRDSDDPIGDALKMLTEKVKEMAKGVGDSIKTMFEDFKTSSLATFGPMTEDFISWLWENLKVFINETLGMKLFDIEGDFGIRTAAKGLIGEDSSTGILSTATIGGETGQDLGNVYGVGGLIKSKDAEGTKSVKGERNLITSNVADRLQKMHDISRESGFRLQWEGLGFKMTDLGIGNDVGNASKGVFGDGIPIANIMNATPILDDTKLTIADLTDKDFSLLKSAGVTKEDDEKNVKAIMKNLKKVADMRFKISQGNLRFGPDKLGGQLYEDRIDELLMENQQKYLAKPGLIADFQKDMMENLNEMAEKALTDSPTSSIFTHDNTMHRLLEPVSKAFADGNNNAPVIMDNSSNNNSVTKQGDTIQMPLGVHTTDPTAHAFHEWKYA